MYIGNLLNLSPGAMSIPIKYSLSIYIACSFKKAGYSGEVHKKERGQCPTMLTEQDWTLKDLLCGQEEEEAKLPLRNRNKRGKSQASKMGPHFPLR